MNEKTKYYKLKFIAGELAGREFALDDFVIIGRARTAHIRPGAEDIAPEHISLAVEQDGSVMMHVFTNALTAVNDFELSGDTDMSLPLLSDVRLGKELTFVLEESPEPFAAQPLPGSAMGDEEAATEDITADMPAEPEPAVPAAPENPADPENPDTPKKPEELGEPAPASGEDENMTRYASPAELETLKKLNRNIKLKRKAVFTVAAIVCIAVIAGSFFFKEYQTENPLTWPGLLANKIDDSEYFIDLGNGVKCMVFYPNTPLMKVQKEKRSCAVMTAIGKNRDVPFHLDVTVTDLENGFRIPSEKSYQAWYTRMSDENGFSFYGDRARTFFRARAHGFPAYKIRYTRIFGKSRWQGVATYMRWQDKEIVLLREVPQHHFVRAKTLLRLNDCFEVSVAWSNRHWEVPEKLVQGDPSELLLRAHRELSRNINFIPWKDLSLILRTLLAQAAINKDQKMYDSVMPLWLSFREKQEIWYTRHCLAYITCQNADDSEGMQKIKNICLKQFNTPDDYRHLRILENIWEID